LLKQNKYSAARPLVDEYLGNPKNTKTAEIWYFKGKTYAGLTAENSTSFSLPDGRRESLEAFSRSLVTDSNQAVMLLTLDSYQPVYSLYTSGMQQAVDRYNAEKFDDALRLLRETAMVGSFIYQRGWDFPDWIPPSHFTLRSPHFRQGKNQMRLFISSNWQMLKWVLQKTMQLSIESWQDIITKKMTM
jgi:hypothetical protein